MPPTQNASKSYVWFSSDVLGTGATGSVYYCRHKKSGDLCAVKTFTRFAEMRPFEVQMREFEVFKKLNHPNIVRLLAIEVDLMTGRKVIIMELCNGGSLHSILEDPQSLHGLDQNDFLSFLDHLTAGMQHLREQQVVHRDIKPGNILRYITQDGSFVYKLTDFGAARELEEDSQFMSIYGTEEYLHPDVYERGVLRQSTGKKFSAVIDLWSMGATLYHTATGTLPFRPHGGRKNKLTMHMMTAQKGADVISGIQHSENGDIEWKTELPDTCLLSRSIRRHLNKLLRGLLELRADHLWTFEDFFREAHLVVRKVRVYVFDVNHGELVDLYLDPSDSFAKLQEEIAELTDISANNQLLLYKNHEFTQIVSELAPAKSYPQSTESQPFFLFHTGVDEFPTLRTPKIPLFQTISAQMAIDETYAISKDLCGKLHRLGHYVKRSVLEQNLMREAAEQFRHLITRYIERCRDHAVHFRLTADLTYRLIHRLQRQYDTMKPCLPAPLSKELSQLIGTRVIPARELLNAAEEVCAKCEDHYHKSVLGNGVTFSSNPSQYCTEQDRCFHKVDIPTKDSREMMEEFANLRRQKKPFPEDIKFQPNKTKLAENCDKCVNVVVNHCLANQVALHQRLGNWYSHVTKIRQNVSQLETRLNLLAEKQKEMAATQEMIEMAFDERLKGWRPNQVSATPSGDASSVMMSPNNESTEMIKKWGPENRAADLAASKRLLQEFQEFEKDQKRMMEAAQGNMDMLKYLSDLADSVNIED